MMGMLCGYTSRQAGVCGGLALRASALCMPSVPTTMRVCMRVCMRACMSAAHRSVQSHEPDTSVFPSTLSATQYTAPVCPSSVRRHSPDAMDHTLQQHTHTRVACKQGCV